MPKKPTKTANSAVQIATPTAGQRAIERQAARIYDALDTDALPYTGETLAAARRFQAAAAQFFLAAGNSRFKHV